MAAPVFMLATLIGLIVLYFIRREGPMEQPVVNGAQGVTISSHHLEGSPKMQKILCIFTYNSVQISNPFTFTSQFTHISSYVNNNTAVELRGAGSCIISGLNRMVELGFTIPRPVNLRPTTNDVEFVGTATCVPNIENESDTHSIGVLHSVDSSSVADFRLLFRFATELNMTQEQLCHFEFSLAYVIVS